MSKKLVISLFFVIFALVNPQAQAGIVHLAHDASGGTLSSNGSTPYPITVSSSTQGNLLVALVTWCCNSSIPTISDSAFNTWTKLGAVQTDGGGEDWVVFYYTLSTIGGATSISIGPNTNANIGVSYAEFSGVNPTSPVQTSVGTANSNTTAANAGSITPTQSGELFIVISYDDSATANATVGTGFTALAEIIPNTTAQGVGAEYKINAGTTAVSGTMTWNANNNLPTIMGAFLPATIRHKAAEQ